MCVGGGGGGLIVFDADPVGVCVCVASCLHSILIFKVVIIIIISLFQEDNIFGTNASLTYGPRLQR